MGMEKYNPMNNLLPPIQQYWDIIQPIIHKNLAPISYFEFGEEGCKFEKDGKIFEIKIKEVVQQKQRIQPKPLLTQNPC